MDLIATLKRSEGKTLEFKRDLSSPRGIVRTVVAFANTAGGVLLVGVEDKTGFVRGVADVLTAEERLANILADTVTPQVMPDIEVLPWRDVYVIAAEIFPSSRRPHRVRAEGANGIYVRVGSTNRRADPPLVDEMRRFANRQAYDEEPLPQLRSEAVDFRAASEWFAPKRKLRRSDLDTLRLVARDQARKVPTVGGILLFGSEKERHFPDAWIQAGRFRGENRVHIADQRDIRGHAPALVERATAFVVEHLSCGAHIEGTRRQDRWNVPPVAVREAVVNAVAHADYAQRGGPIRVAVFSDRVEVENPGLLPFGLTIEDLPRGVSKLRNRVIARSTSRPHSTASWNSLASSRDGGVGQRRPAHDECVRRGRLPAPGVRGAGQPLPRDAGRLRPKRGDGRCRRSAAQRSAGPGRPLHPGARRRHRTHAAHDARAAEEAG